MDNIGQLANIDLDTGEVGLIGEPGEPVSDMVFDTHNALWGVDGTTFYNVKPDTSYIAVGKHSIPGANALAFGSDGTLYAAGSGSTWLYTIDMTTGASTPVADVGHICDGGMAFLNDKIYFSSLEQLISVSIADNWSAAVVGSIGFDSVWGLTVDNKGTLYGFSHTDVITINPETGVGTRLWSVTGEGLGSLCGGSFADET